MIKELVVLGLCLLIAVLLVLSRHLEHEYDGQVREYGFILPGLAGLGLFLVSRLPFSKSWLQRERGIRVRLNQLYGYDRAELFHHIHLAQKLILLGSLAAFLLLVALLGDGGSVFALLSAGVLAVVWLELDRELDKKLHRRKQSMLIDWPEFLNVLVLLLGAGLPFQTALERAIKERDPERPLYRELYQLAGELHNGAPLNLQLEELARRCRVAEVTRFVAGVLPVLRQGSKDLAELLALLAQEAWEKRKEIAKKQGEEAAAKLVLPMVMVFVAIAIIVLAPAIISMEF